MLDSKNRKKAVKLFVSLSTTFSPSDENAYNESDRAEILEWLSGSESVGDLQTALRQIEELIYILKS